ncbi:MAG: TolC family protein, partial [Acetobacteraceae bacterium]
MMERQHLPALRTPIAVLSLFLGSCATYRPKPLPTGPDLARAPELTVPANGFAVPGLEPHLIDPSQGLDLVAVAELAVLNNPDLKAQRLQADIANAQVIDAGLLPDPELSAGLTHSPEHRGYSLGLGEELQAIVTRGARRGAAQAHARQVNLEILWQEWQVAEKARELSVEATSNEQLRRLLGVHRELLAERYRRDRAAMEQGTITAGIVTADFSALSDADAQIRDLALQANEASHA